MKQQWYLAAFCGLLVASQAQAQSMAFRSGLVDRQVWEQWFTALRGQEMTGADFWASQRSKPQPIGCQQGSSGFETAWLAACFEASRRLASSDIRRRTEPDYRRGWNSYLSSADFDRASVGTGLPRISAQRERDAVERCDPADYGMAASASYYSSIAVRECVQRRDAAQAMINQRRTDIEEMRVANERRRDEDARRERETAQRDAQARMDLVRKAEVDGRAARQVAAENAPDNFCAKPEFARIMMQQMEGLDTFKVMDLKIVDIEHLVTVEFEPLRHRTVCHGSFVTSRGGSLVGTFETKKNIVGDDIFSWKKD